MDQNEGKDARGASRLHAELDEMPLVVRDFSYRVAITSRDPSVELMQLLAQAMDSYHDISDAERRAVVHWFSTCYGDPV